MLEDRDALEAFRLRCMFADWKANVHTPGMFPPRWKSDRWLYRWCNTAFWFPPPTAFDDAERERFIAKLR